MNSFLSILTTIDFKKSLILTLFMALGLVMTSNYLIENTIDDLASDAFEKTKEMDEKEKENESEEEDDDKLEDFLRLKSQKQNKISFFDQDNFSHLNSHSKHIGDTSTPPPDLI